MDILVACEGRDYTCYFDEPPQHNSIIDAKEILNEALKDRVVKEFDSLAVVKYCGAVWNHTRGKEMTKIELFPLKQIAFAGV